MGSLHQEQLPHAMLFVGADGIGKKQFADVLASTLLCNERSESGVRCGECHACHLANAKSHPDLMLIEPEEEGKAISVDRIRDVVKFVNETTYKGGFRVIIIYPATAMNTNAANALLKTLEEPTPNTLIILISNQGLRLPATILSRCQKVIFAKPSPSVALEWLRLHVADDKVDLHLLLKLADGAPLKALKLKEKELISLRNDLYQGLHLLSEGKTDPIQLAAKWHDSNHLPIVDLLLSWLIDILRYKLTHDQVNLTNSDYRNEIKHVSLMLTQNNLIAYLDHLQQTRSDLLSPVNLNKQLVLEDLFIRWTSYVSS